MNKKIVIGKVNSAFGIKGEVKIISYCQNPTQIENYSVFDEKGNIVKIKISNKNKTVIGSSGSGDAILIATIAGITNRTDAEKLHGQELYINRDQLEETDEDEFYHTDLIGLKVIDADKKEIGKVLNIYDFGAGSMLEIEFLAANPKKNLEKIENFPFKNMTFPEVNVKEGFIRIELPEVVKGDLKE